jgi:hypothetical protein
MPITFSSVTCWEMDGSPTEEWSAGGLRASVQLRTAWDDRYDLLEDMLDDAILYPHYPDSGSRAVSGSIERLTNSRMMADGQGADYGPGFAVVTVNFEYVEREEGENGDIYSESIEPNAEFMTLDHNLFVWQPVGGFGEGEIGGSEYSDGIPLKPAEAPARLLVSLDYQQTQYKMASVPAAYLSLIGYVNAATVTAPIVGLTFPAETLLFHPPKLSRSINVQGTGLWTAQKRFSYKPSGWNKHWHARAEAYTQYYHKGTETPYQNYPTGDLSAVISGA